MQEPSKSSTPTLIVQRIMWVGFLNALIIYGILANVMDLDAGADPSVSMTIWWVVAALMAMATVLVPRLLSASVSPYTRRMAGWVLAESIGVIGLVALFVVSAPVKSLYAFLGVAFVLILLQFPRD